VVVEGPAGVGKTALLDAARAYAERAGFLVLAASGVELEQDLAFALARQLFERSLLAVRGSERAEMLSGAAVLARRVLLDPDPEPTPDAFHAAVHGLHWLAVEFAADRPVLLVVDDAHWADAASLRWLAYTARRLDGVPLLALIAGRESEPGADAGLFAAIGAAANALLRPRPLGRAGAGEYLAAAFETDPVDAFCEECLDATGGNPFLLGELVASLRADGVAPDDDGAGRVATIAPAGIARSVLARLVRLGAAAVAVAEAVAVLSSDVRLDRVAALAGVPLASAAAVLDQLTAAAILRPGDPVTFRHPILRAAVYGGIPSQRRALAHLAAAERLLAEGEERERAAAHLLNAPPGRREWVVCTLREAAARAAARGAPEVSVALLRRALLDCSPDCGAVLLELAEAELTVRDPAAPAHAHRAMAAATTPLGRTRAGLLAARALTPLGRCDEIEEALAVVERASAELDPGPRQAARFELLVLTTWQRGVSGMAPALVELGVDGLAGARASERQLLALRAIERASVGSDLDQVLRCAYRVLEQGDPRDAGEETALVMAGRALTFADRLDDARACFTALVDAGRARGSVAPVALACAMRSEAGYRAGDLTRAATDAREALEIAAEHDLVVAVAAAMQFSAELLLEREPVGVASALLERHAGGAIPGGFPENMVLYARGRTAAIAGDLDAAAELLTTCGRARLAWGERNPAACPWRSELALVRAHQGRTEEAERLAADEVGLARAFGTARALGIALRGQALVRTGRARAEGLLEAAAVLTGSPARLEYARVLLDLGAEQRRSGRRRSARATLARALDLAGACGAHALAERCRAELVTAGARPRRERLSGPASLTAGEWRVAELAAEGMTNRRIAQALFLTTKTVETHLSHAYMKLNIAGRAELAVALGLVARISEGAVPEARAA
jgi:DNA-binding CsgD family transcriptional regulator